MSDRDEQAIKELWRAAKHALGRHALELGITVAALSAAALHLAFRDVAIDNVTIGLALLAALPWLSHIVSAITVPGFHVQFRELEKKVDAISHRVDELNDFVIQGVGKEQRDKMSAHLAKLREYLVPFAGDLVKPPRVYVEGSYMASCYIRASHEIVIQREFADDIDMVSREYMHSVLLSPPKSIGPSFEIRGLESGLADYYVASEKGEPKLYLGSGVREIQLANDRKFVDGFDQNDAGNDLGEIWGGAFWRIRDLLGRSAADKALWTTWMSANLAGDRSDETSVRTDFVEQLVAVVETLHGEERARQVAQIFAARGVSQLAKTCSGTMKV